MYLQVDCPVMYATKFVGDKEAIDVAKQTGHQVWSFGIVMM